MAVMFLILPLALLFAAAALWAFIASVRRGQFDDLTTPPLRMLCDDDEPANPGRQILREPIDGAVSTKDEESKIHEGVASNKPRPTVNHRVTE
jgi:cbb3-type cytochrome oxidase maturation protein